MISEVEYATKFGSLWGSLAPTSAHYLRQINSVLSIKAFPEIVSLGEPSRFGLVNETAFNAFAEVFKTESFVPRHDHTLSETEIDAAFIDARAYIKNIENVEIADLSLNERMEVGELFDRLKRLFFQEINARSIVFSPSFEGCGILNSCRGDIMSSDMLYEIKAGNRPFRSHDLRQILIYVALHKQSKNKIIENICLMNPRTGMRFQDTTTNLCFEVSGKTIAELCYQIIEAVSSGGISR